MNDFSDAIAVQIASDVLKTDLVKEALVWLVFDEKRFFANDGLPRYFPEELKFLATKTPAELRSINDVKTAFLGLRVRE